MLWPNDFQINLFLTKNLSEETRVTYFFVCKCHSQELVIDFYNVIPKMDHTVKNTFHMDF